MPDLITQYFWKCDREQMFDVPSSDGSKTYEVTIRGWEFHCTCPRHKFHPEDHCKHVKKALKKFGACRWNQLIDGGDAAKIATDSEGHYEFRCPNCCGPVTSFGEAV